MTCNYVVVEGKTIAIVCDGRRRPWPKPCHVCRAPSDWLCDAMLNTGKTCDRPMCDQHRVRIDGATDYCPEHARPPVSQLGLLL